MKSTVEAASVSYDI